MPDMTAEVESLVSIVRGAYTSLVPSTLVSAPKISYAGARPFGEVSRHLGGLAPLRSRRLPRPPATGRKGSRSA